MNQRTRRLPKIGEDEERSREVAGKEEQKPLAARSGQKTDSTDDVENGCASSSRESPREELICDEAKKREAEHNEMFVDVLIVERTMQEEIRIGSSGRSATCA